MLHTYTQLHVHVVFSTKYRAAIIGNNWREELHKYITGIVQSKGHKMIVINSVPDHIHVLIGLRPNQAVAELVGKIKRETTAWIHLKKLCRERFAWQEGYGAFAVDRVRLHVVISYIHKQQEHHRTKTFEEEYIEFLKEEDIMFDERYLFAKRP